MQIPHLEPPVRYWECEHCNTTDVTREARPHTRYHTCPGLKGITAPLTEVDKRGKQRVRAVVREDYEGPDANKVQRNDEGTPIMAVETVHDDGHTDLAVLATGISAKIVME